VSIQRNVESLNALFATQQIVFWHDAEGEFASAVGTLPLGDTQLIRLDQMPVLKVKLELERAGSSGKWLLDIRLRSKRILLPMSSVTDIPTVPGELFAKFQTSFSDPVDAAFKALGVE